MLKHFRPSKMYFQFRVLTKTVAFNNEWRIFVNLCAFIKT